MNSLVLKTIGIGINAISFVAPNYAAKLVLELFAKPRKGKTQHYMHDFYDNFEKLTLKSSSGFDVQVYHKRGKGKCILLAHGWESNAFRWRKLMPHLLREDYEIVMLDAPAHGSSGGEYFTALYYAEFLAVVAAKYQPSIIIGHSIGGFAMMYYLSNYQPQFVHQMVVMASPDRMDDITTTYFDMMGYRKKLRAHYDVYISKKYSISTETFASSFFVKNIDVTGIVIHSKDDDINFFKDGVAIADSWSGGELIEVDGYGHGLQSEVVFEILNDFLKREESEC